jgi:hypothetical protein
VLGIAGGEPAREVVGGPPRRIAEDLPRRIDAGHPGGIGPGRHVRVVFLGQAPVSSLDDLVLGLGIDLQDLVRVQRIGHSATPVTR